MKIAATDYMGKLAGDGNIKLYVKGTVEETGQRYATQDVVEMKKPRLVVTVNAYRTIADCVNNLGNCVQRALFN